MGHANLRATPIKVAKDATRYLTITSMTTPQQETLLFQEGRLILALNAHKQGQFLSFQSAVKTYNVPRTIAQQRDKGIKLRRGSIAPNRRLILVQEESLKQWILSMYQRGIPPRVTTIR